eukprot:TRINITY_DN1449_c0_g1_i2.p2 TRINITY_DN1449_c0_g1~~TRINITY_DN1449_c0_g1_i2.p2  ORF type:complete len:104 (+),score=20.23 TRINITY_DN1449_c0_g1_i2:470-781(+)
MLGYSGIISLIQFFFSFSFTSAGACFPWLTVVAIVALDRPHLHRAQSRLGGVLAAAPHPTLCCAALHTSTHTAPAAVFVAQSAYLQSATDALDSLWSFLRATS